MSTSPSSFDLSRAGTEEARERALRASRAGVEARKVERRPHPATSESTYSDEEWEFIKAVDAYRRATGTPFPSWVEVYKVFRGLGYSKSARAAPPDDAVPG